jgi:ArsR family transcriptional regulator, arsenate/arsenite/antimonite-responsive transcriptional repressor
MKEFVKVMKALSDPNRVKILKLLQQRMLCVCETQAALGLAQPTISKHFKILEDAGLVTRRKEGLWVNYHLADGSRSPYAATLLGSLKHWLAGDAEMKKLMERLPAIRREDICRQDEA